MRDKFEDRFRAVQRAAVAAAVFNAVVLLGVLGFVGWVIVKVMQYFGVI